MVILSVCPSVTTRYQSKTRWDRDFGFSPYDSLLSLVFRDKISSRWVKGIPSNKGAKEGHSPLKSVILPLLACLTWKWLQICTDMLLIITSTGVELFRNVNVDDLEWPSTLKIAGFSEFFSQFCAATRISRVNCAKMARDGPRLPAYKIFSMECRF